VSSFSSLFRATVSVVLFSIFLQSCTVGPKYVAPKPVLMPFHNHPAAPSDDGAPAATLDHWWTGFKDPMLVTVIDRALAQNLNLVAALARVDEASAAAAGAGARLKPAAELDGSSTFARQSLQGNFGNVARGVPSFRRDIHEYSVGPAASWEIDLAGGLRRGAMAAREDAEAAEADHIGTRVIVTADAADAYLQVRGYQARLVVAQRQIVNDEHLVQLVKNRYDAGAATQREIAQAQALLEQARATVPMLRVGLERQLNRLDVLMGAQPGTYARELSPASEIPAVPPLPADQQPTDLLRRRPDIIAAERRVAASNDRIGAVIANYYPKISLSGVLGFDSLTAEHLFTGSAFQAVGVGGLRWRLFDFGRIDAEVAQARGANAEALAVYRQAVLKAAEDVEDALSLLSQTQLYAAELRSASQSLLRARDLAEAAYRAGSITLTDVLDADRELLTVQDQIDASRADVARAAVTVFRALGGGWEPPR